MNARNFPKSSLELSRLEYKPKLPTILQDLDSVHFLKEEAPPCLPEIASLFPLFANLPVLKAAKTNKKKPSPLRVGVVFSGGPAPGGHNVISALFDATRDGTLIGFLDGPAGILEGSYREIVEEEIDGYRNLGGFDLLGSGRIKIESPKEMEKAFLTCKNLLLDGLVVIGGDDSNTNAAILADFFKKKGGHTTVVGIPKTIDADLKNDYIATSFGFDTASRVYSEIIGNICKDTISSKKYTHFIKLMGRAASHITLECALATQPNYTLIGEEIRESKKTLFDIVLELTDLIIKRADIGKPYNVILIPEGLIQFIPEISILIEEIDLLLAEKETSLEKLSPASKRCFNYLPKIIQEQLLLERDSHGNFPLSAVETDKLLSDLVSRELQKRKEEGSFTGSFSPLLNFLGYEGRAALPSNFDADYCYSLGLTVALLIRAKASGYIAFIKNLDKDVASWAPGAIPIACLMQMEVRGGVSKPVIEKALVDLEGNAFKYFKAKRELWTTDDQYRSPGPMQFCNKEKDEIPLSLSLNLEREQEMS